MVKILVLCTVHMYYCSSCFYYYMIYSMIWKKIAKHTSCSLNVVIVKNVCTFNCSEAISTVNEFSPGFHIVKSIDFYHKLSCFVEWSFCFCWAISVPLVSSTFLLEISHGFRLYLEAMLLFGRKKNQSKQAAMLRTGLR